MKFFSPSLGGSNTFSGRNFKCQCIGNGWCLDWEAASNLRFNSNISRGLKGPPVASTPGTCRRRLMLTLKPQAQCVGIQQCWRSGSCLLLCPPPFLDSRAHSPVLSHRGQAEIGPLGNHGVREIHKSLHWLGLP